MQIYICGIHTDAGKSHFAAAFCRHFKYDYFKLIQAGEPTDSELVARLSPKTNIFKAGITLKTPASPHIAMRLENTRFNALSIKIPDSENLLIELAGGLLTPADDKSTMLDFMAQNPKNAILVGRYYLGCINHILLSIEALRARKIPILCVAMMQGERADGDMDDIDSFVYGYCGVEVIRMPFSGDGDLKAKIAPLLKR